MALSRRVFLRNSAVAAFGCVVRPRTGLAGICETGALPLSAAWPQIKDHPSTLVDGLPFYPWWLGDDFDNNDIPFHVPEAVFPGGKPPSPAESVDIAVIGGGLSGLATAYLLREFRPVVFELHPAWGGAAQGEQWNSLSYSLGGAYVITPDKGTFLDQLYRELHLDSVVHVDKSPFELELNGQVVDPVAFWSGRGLPQREAEAIAAYQQVVAYYANEAYPDIPLPEGRDNDWILDLDTRTLKDDIEQRMGQPAPPVLAAAIQAYCYSSFGAGWEEISAASGWNFLAAEEFGRWVFPGGNAYIIGKLWKELAQVQGRTPPGCQPEMLRAGCRVVDMRLTPDDHVQITYRDAKRQFRSLLARRAVLCCPKHVVRHLLPDLERLDREKLHAMHQISTRAYVVANVLLNTPMALDFYDVFLLGDGVYPVNEPEAEIFSRPIDALNGTFAALPNAFQSVLTLYWPLPFGNGRFTLVTDDAWQNYAQGVAGRLKGILNTLKLPLSAVQQIRMVRWAHALPIARPGLIANGVCEQLRRPIADRIFFINQDNWALPAVENCLLDAEIFVPQIAAGL